MTNRSLWPVSQFEAINNNSLCMHANNIVNKIERVSFIQGGGRDSSLQATKIEFLSGIHFNARLITMSTVHALKTSKNDSKLLHVHMQNNGNVVNGKWLR